MNIRRLRIIVDEVCFKYFRTTTGINTERIAVHEAAERGAEAEMDELREVMQVQKMCPVCGHQS